MIDRAHGSSLERLWDTREAEDEQEEVDSWGRGMSLEACIRTPFLLLLLFPGLLIFDQTAA